MTGARAAVVLALSLLGPAPAQTETPGEPELSEDAIRRILTHSPLGDPPPDSTNAALEHPVAARLGQRLFFDARLSADGAVSCATCHDPAKSFADGKALGEGLGRLQRNTPSLWNAAYQRWYFWDGRADTLWSQALKPTEHPDEMGGNRARVAHLIHDDPLLRADYETVFGPLPELDDSLRFPAEAMPGDGAWEAMDPDDQFDVNRVFANYGKALAAYQRGLVSRRSVFDVFVEGLREDDPGKLAALGPAERRGLLLFTGKGRCRMCHAGPNFSDGEFHGTGVAPLGGGDLFDPARYDGIRLLRADPFNALGLYSDDRDGERAAQVETLAHGPETWGEFKTPTLRNVALSAPYMHQGQFASLAEVVRFYSTLEGSAPPGHHQEQVLQPLDLSASEQADLVAFLESLTDLDVAPELLRPLP